MISNVWKHIRSLEKLKGIPHLARELIDDAQEYYQYLLSA